MKHGFSLSTAAQLALLGSVFLAGCPSASDLDGRSPVAGVIIEATKPAPEDGYVPANAEAMVTRMLELVNNERTSRGLEPLTLNPILCKMADDYAAEMIQCGFFSHQSPSGGPFDRAVSANYVFLAIGENLAGGQSTPEQAMADWMKSTEGHRENILSPQWKDIGIAVRVGGEYGVYWVQEFGNPPAGSKSSQN